MDFEVSSEECKVQSVKCRVWNLKCKLWSLECKSAKCGVQRFPRRHGDATRKPETRTRYVDAGKTII